MLLEDGEQLVDRRKTKTFLQALSKVFAADLTALRQRYRDFLGHKGLVPLPLHSSFILVPLKVRRVQYKATGNRLCSLDKVEDLHFPERDLPGAGVCQLSLKGNYLKCRKGCNSKKRLAEHLRFKGVFSFFEGRKISIYP